MSLSPGEREFLLELARESLARHLRGEGKPAFTRPVLP